MPVWDAELGRWRAVISDYLTSIPATPAAGLLVAWLINYTPRSPLPDHVTLNTPAIVGNEPDYNDDEVYNLSGVRMNVVISPQPSADVIPDAANDAAKIAAKQALADEYLLAYTVQNATSETVQGRSFIGWYVSDQSAWWARRLAFGIVHPLLAKSGNMAYSSSPPKAAPLVQSVVVTAAGSGLSQPMWARWRKRIVGTTGARFPELTWAPVAGGIRIVFGYVPGTEDVASFATWITTHDGVGYTTAAAATAALGITDLGALVGWGNYKGIAGMRQAVAESDDRITTNASQVTWSDRTKPWRLRVYALTADAEASALTGDEWLASTGVTLLYDVEIHSPSDVGPAVPIDKRLDETVSVDLKANTGIRLNNVTAGAASMAGGDGGGF